MVMIQDQEIMFGDNFITYLKWRGDLSFESSPANELDYLILSQLSYFLLENIADEEETLTIQEVQKRLSNQRVSSRITEEEDRQFLYELAASARFRDITLGHFKESFGAEQTVQFAAVTVFLPGHKLFLSYRGTDMSLIGWKEDFYMVFSEAIPAQIRAGEYLEEIAARYDRDLILGGHSKGGNLALYAASTVSEKLQSRIQDVYVYDAPGLTEDLFRSEGYRRIQERVHAVLPQNSIVGILLMHPESYQIVESSARGIMQHDPFSWKMLGTSFLLKDTLQKENLYLETLIRRWTTEIEEEKLKLLIDTVFEILEATKADTIDQLRTGIMKKVRLAAAAMKEIPESDKKELLEIFNGMAETALEEAKNQKTLKGTRSE